MTIAILGMGLIGSIWARNHHADGRSVTTWNRTPKPESPGWCADPIVAITGASAIIICVADPPAVQQVLERILPHLQAGQTIVQTSTISPEWTRRFAAQVQATGAAYLDTPFTGSKPAAEARQTVFYAGGEAAVLERVRPVLTPLSKAIVPIGDIGDASALKLAMNLNLAMMMQALSESLILARRAGISSEIFFAALKLNAGQSPLAELKQPKLLARDWTPQFSVKHMGKDLHLALDGHEGLPQSAAVLHLYDQALAKGWGDDDFASLLRLLDPG